MSLTEVENKLQLKTFLSPEEKEDENVEEAKEEVTNSPGHSSSSPSPISKLYSCRWCKKNFSFKCRMLAHLRRCLMCPENQQQCPHCPAKLPSQRALKRHQVDAHSSSTQLKKKATCDLCGRTFAHPSGQDSLPVTHTHHAKTGLLATYIYT